MEAKRRPSQRLGISALCEFDRRAEGCAAPRRATPSEVVLLNESKAWMGAGLADLDFDRQGSRLHLANWERPTRFVEHSRIPLDRAGVAQEARAEAALYDLLELVPRGGRRHRDGRLADAELAGDIAPSLAAGAPANVGGRASSAMQRCHEPYLCHSGDNFDVIRPAGWFPYRVAHRFPQWNRNCVPRRAAKPDGHPAGCLPGER